VRSERSKPKETWTGPTPGLEAATRAQEGPLRSEAGGRPPPSPRAPGNRRRRDQAAHDRDQRPSSPHRDLAKTAEAGRAGLSANRNEPPWTCKEGIPRNRRRALAGAAPGAEGSGGDEEPPLGQIHAQTRRKRRSKADQHPQLGGTTSPYHQGQKHGDGMRATAVGRGQRGRSLQGLAAPGLTSCPGSEERKGEGLDLDLGSHRNSPSRPLRVEEKRTTPKTCLRSAAGPSESGETLPERDEERNRRRGAAARHPLCRPARRARGSRWEPSL
jgi:hypothetical protein